jgi:hypothetical protein
MSYADQKWEPASPPGDVRRVASLLLQLTYRDMTVFARILHANLDISQPLDHIAEALVNTAEIIRNAPTPLTANIGVTNRETES